MTSSRRYGRLLQAASLGLIGMLTVVGCGGSETNRPDTAIGRDAGDALPALKAQLNADQASVTVGNVDVGKTSAPVLVRITNTGTAAAAVKVTPSGVLATGCPASLVAKAFCTLSITATPTVAGPIVGSVTVAAEGANTVIIGVTGNANMPGNFSLSNTISLGDVAVNSPNKAVVTVTANATLTGITTGVSSAGSNLKIDSTTCLPTATLIAGSTCLINVTFSSATAGRATTDAVTVTQGGVTRSVLVTANVLNLAKLIATPISAAFLAAPGSTSAPIAINIGNTGGLVTGDMAVALSGANAADFKITDDKCTITKVLPTAFCTVTVVFAPPATVVANEVAVLTISDKGAGLSSVTVNLTGTPTPASALAITGGPDLGSVARGTTGAEVIFTVTNSSTTPSGALTTTVSDASIVVSSNTCVTKATLNKDETCTIGLKLAPAATAAPAAIAAVLTVTGTSGKASASVTGTIVGGAALSANPTSISFGSLPIGQVSADQSITITNTGATATGVPIVTLTGAGAAQVALVGNTCTAALAPAGTCTIAVRYSPTDTSGVNGGINITDGSASLTIPMVGTGLIISTFTVSVGASTASIVSMGAKALGYTTAPTTLTVAVPASSSMDSGLISAVLSGDNAADFAYVNNCLVSIVPGANCTITVTFTPSATGDRAAVLTVAGGKGGSWPVVLSGVGLALVEVAPQPAPTAPATGLDFGSAPNGSAGIVQTYRMTVRGATAITATSTVSDVALVTGTPTDYRNYPAATTNVCDADTLGLTASTGAAVGTPPSGWSISGGFWICDFDIQFYPQTGRDTAPKTATVTASATAGGTSSITLTGIATGPLLFDNRASTDVTILNNDTLVLVNKGAAGVNQGPIVVDLGGANEGDFSITSDGCTLQTLIPTVATVAPYTTNSFCNIVVAFTPASVGVKTATVTATAPSGEVATATITGTSGPTFAVTIDPTSNVNAPVDFGFVVQGNVGAWQSFTISNPDGALKSGKLWYQVSSDFELYTLATAGVTAYPSGFCGDNDTKQLDGGESCIIQVRFKPVNTAVIGARTGSLTVKVGSSTGTPILSADGLSAIQLSGTATSQLTIAPAALDFGDVAANLPGVEETTITNNGLTALTLTIPSITTVPTVQIVSEANTAGGCNTGMSLAAGANCVLKYKFQGATPGTNIGYATDGTPVPVILTVTNGANVSAQVTVVGKVVMPAILARYGADDTNALNLGNVVVGSPSGTATLWFTNTGEVAATGINASVTAGSEFAIPAESGAESPCNSLPANTLAAKGICSVQVQLTPTSAGAKTATLSLVGTGLAGVQVALAGVGHGASTAGVYADLVSAAPATFATIDATAVASITSKVYYTLRNNTTGTLDWGSLNITEFDETVAVDEFILAAEATSGGTACSTATNGILASSTCQFAVRFTPATYGATDGRKYRWATINYSLAPLAGVMGQVQKPAKLQLTATSTTSALVTNASNPALSSVNFGQVLETGNDSITFTITNIGDTPTAGAVVPTITHASGAVYATETNDCGTGVLAAGASCTATVTVQSVDTGVHNVATIQATGTTAENSAEIFTLILKTVRPSLLSLSPVTGTGTDFGAATYVGAIDSGLITITVKNGSTGDTSDTRQDSGALTVTSSNTSDFTIMTGSSTCYNSTTGLYKVLGGAVPADLSCTLVVQFNPRSVGARTTTLSIGATPGTALSVNLTGTGLADLTISPAGTAAAPAFLSAAPTTGVFTITNNGPSATSLLGTTVGGANADLFTITNNTCVGHSIAAAGTCTVTLAFTGTSNATTAQTATLTVTDGTANNTVTAYTKVGGP